MADNVNAANETAAATDDEKKRFRSELTFPYSDLESCVELAQTLHSRAGTSCDQGELAAWMNQSAAGGTFRTRISAAKMFGLIDTGQGRATLLPLGRDAIEGSGKERAARIQAFLTPELFIKMYEQNKGHPLPPAAAIERQIEQFGVSPKQKERARQTFLKSATYAGFIDPGTGRFVKPGIGGAREDAGAAPESERDGGNSGAGGGGGPPKIDPIIQGLLARLPKSGAVWAEAERKLWLQLLEGSFKLIYLSDPPEHIKANRRAPIDFNIKNEDVE
jgi:hypothetical protein